MAKRISIKKQQLIEVAIALFLEQGIKGTGIAQILEHAGVAKMTLYKHFESKDQLIIAAVKSYAQLIRESLRAYLDDAYSDAAEKLLGIFDWLDWRFAQQGGKGCLLIGATMEFGQDPQGQAVYQAVIEQNKLFKAYFRGLTSMAGAQGPAGLADQIFQLYQGAVITGQTTDDPRVSARAKQMARLHLAHAKVNGLQSLN